MTHTWNAMARLQWADPRLDHQDPQYVEWQCIHCGTHRVTWTVKVFVDKDGAGVCMDYKYLLPGSSMYLHAEPPCQATTTPP